MIIYKVKLFFKLRRGISIIRFTTSRRLARRGDVDFIYRLMSAWLHQGEWVKRETLGCTSNSKGVLAPRKEVYFRKKGETLICRMRLKMRAYHLIWTDQVHWVSYWHIMHAECDVIETKNILNKLIN